MDVVRHRVPFHQFDPTLAAQVPKDRADRPPQPSVEDFRRYLGRITTWYLHSHLTWDRPCHSCMGSSFLPHGPFPEGGAYAVSRRLHAGSLEAPWVTRPEAVDCASVSVQGQGGASPPQVDALRPVTDGNRVAARRGGKQPEVNRQSATQVNSIRPSRAASLQSNGEAQTGMSRMSPTLRGSVSKRWGGRGGGWRRNGRTAQHTTQRDLRGPDRARARRAGVRGTIVAPKPGNAGGAKGPREMDAT